MTVSIDDVREFWQAHPCGSDTVEGPRDLAWFEGVERFRYANEPAIPHVARWAEQAGRDVLEIGCGLGTDGVQFAEAGARYTGVDLTEAAVAEARENFRLRGLEGRFAVANAERLPFEDGSFDHVYSFGVIHHTERPEAIVAEIRRVLRPGGTVTVMLYNRTSVNYRLGIMGARRVGRWLLAPPWAPKVLAGTLRLPREKLEGHRRNLLRIPHPTPEQWISMNTDGPECPLARVYSDEEARALFAGFTRIRTDVHRFDRSHWPGVGRVLPDAAADTLGRRWGWHRMVYAQTPA